MTRSTESSPLIQNLAKGTPVGLIAGNGRFPLAVANKLLSLGLTPVIAAHRGETSPEIERITGHCTWVRVGQLGKIIRIFARAGVHYVAMAGGISRVRIFGDGGARPDWTALRLIARLGSVRDDILLRGVAEELARSGFQVFGASQVLDRAIAERGLLSRRAPDAGEFRDAQIGWDAAKGIGALDIGQTVVTFQGLVVAAEAVDGTDATIRRAGDLTKRRGGGLLSKALLGALSPSSGMLSRGPVVVKVCKPQQDERIDLPTVGSNTIEAMREAGATALIVEAGRTLILDYDDVMTQANAAGISVFAATGLEDLGAA